MNSQDSMRGRLLGIMAAWLFCCSAASFPARSDPIPPGQAPSEIWQDLWAVRSFRNHLKTDYPAMDAKVGEFIQKYQADPGAQGRIYVEALQVHALSGLTRTSEAIQYAKKAEALPLGPGDKAQLYLSWGNAVQMSVPGVAGDAMMPIRREAARLYLKSMRVALDSGAPDTAGPRPEINGAYLLPEDLFERAKTGGMFGLSGVSMESFRKVASLSPQEREQARQAYYEAKAKWELAEAVLPRRDYSRDLIVDIYAKSPLASAEIKAMAAEILADDAMVADLMRRLQARIAERTAQK